MKIMVIGDVVSSAGCDFLMERLPLVKSELGVKLVIANGENSAVGNGITPHSAQQLFSSGVDVITTGNHVFKRREISDYLDKTPQILRPLNFPDDVVGSGYYIYDGGSFCVCVVSILGTSFMEPLASPFTVMDTLLEQISCKHIIVDFHAEATGEKKALGYYLDGRVSAVLGTHTHVQTADEQILNEGTGFITDLGMTGPTKSVLGITPQNVIDRLRTHLPTRFEVATTPCQLEGVVLELDDKSGKCLNVNRLHIE